MRLARRIAVCLAALTGTVAMSGCHEVLRATFGADRPVHRVDGGASPGRAVAAGSAPGRAFTGRAVGRLAGPMKIFDGFVKTRTTNARFIGSFAGRPAGAVQPGDDQLGLLGDAQWHGRFRAVRNRATGQTTLKGLVLATFTDAAQGRACLRVGLRGVRKQHRKQIRKTRTTVTVLGGEGGASTLRGTALGRLVIGRGDNLRLSGRVRTSRGTARGFPAACTKLEKQFGLTPLS